MNPCEIVRCPGWINDVNGQGVSFVTPSVDLAKIKGSPHYRPSNIAFRCQRTVGTIDKSMIAIAKQIEDLTFSALITHPQAPESHRNKRGNLSECNCVFLNRKTNPEIRLYYENLVIQTVENLVTNGKTNINIAMFATGGLHGEQTLLWRLIAQIHHRGYKGVISVVLIDQIYKDSIQKAVAFTIRPKPPAFNWINFIGGREDLMQFLNEMTLVLPPTIQLEGTVFGEADDYISRTEIQPELRNDILIGADIGGNDSYAIMTKLQEKTSRSKQPGISLIKYQEQGVVVPKTCQIKPNGNVHTDCQTVPVAKK